MTGQVVDPLKRKGSLQVGAQTRCCKKYGDWSNFRPAVENCTFAGRRDDLLLHAKSVSTGLSHDLLLPNCVTAGRRVDPLLQMVYLRVELSTRY